MRKKKTSTPRELLSEWLKMEGRKVKWFSRNRLGRDPATLSGYLHGKEPPEDMRRLICKETGGFVPETGGWNEPC